MQCAVCLEDVESDNQHTLSCNHTFHATCLVPWLLGGRTTCPSCRGNAGDAYQEAVGAMTLDARAAYLRRTVARRRNAPAELLRVVHHLRQAEEQERDAARALTAFQREHRDVLLALRRLRVKRWTASRRRRMRRRVLGAFACADYPLPTLAPYVPP